MAESSSSNYSTSEEDRRQDLGELARQYVDLWQQQLSAAASDKALADIMAQTVQLMNAGAAAMTSYASSQGTGDLSAADVGTEPIGGSANVGDTGTAAIAASSGVDKSVVDELHRRIEQLESRIAALESGTGGQGA